MVLYIFDVSYLDIALVSLFVSILIVLLSVPRTQESLINMQQIVDISFKNNQIHPQNYVNARRDIKPKILLRMNNTFSL